MFMVESEKNEDVAYTIDMRSGFCSCFIGQTLAPCKHKTAIAKYFQISHFSALPEFDAIARSFYHFLANGEHLPPNWYRDIDKPEETPQFSQYSEQVVNDVSLVGDDQSDISADISTEQAVVDSNEGLSSEVSDEEDMEETNEAEPGNNVETFSDVSDEETNETIPDFDEKFTQLTNVINGSFKDNLRANWSDPKTRKCLDAFIAQVSKSKNKNVETQKRSMYGYGREVATKTKSGKKAKTNKRI